jgi:hypothetical protein
MGDGNCHNKSPGPHAVARQVASRLNIQNYAAHTACDLRMYVMFTSERRPTANLDIMYISCESRMPQACVRDLGFKYHRPDCSHHSD